MGQADDNIPAQPVTVSPAAGTDQSNFFIYNDGRDDNFVTFDAIRPVTIAHKQDEVHILFSSRISKLTGGAEVFYPTNPLVLKAVYILPANTTFTNFIHSHSDGTFADRELFVIPGRGLYVSTNGGAPVLVYRGAPPTPSPERPSASPRAR